MTHGEPIVCVLSPEAAHLLTVIGEGWTVTETYGPPEADRLSRVHSAHPVRIEAVRGDALDRVNGGDPVYLVREAPLRLWPALTEARLRPVPR